MKLSFVLFNNIFICGLKKADCSTISIFFDQQFTNQISMTDQHFSNQHFTLHQSANQPSANLHFTRAHCSIRFEAICRPSKMPL